MISHVLSGLHITNRIGGDSIDKLIWNNTYIYGNTDMKWPVQIK